jgi:survival of motor neuron-related-splicing factor 30
LKAEIEEAIAATEGLIDELRPALQPAPTEAPSPPTEKPKWSKENHPAFQAGYKKAGAPPTPEELAPVTYKVNDTVLARWLSGDKAYYQARITSITGSSSDPVYYVTFKSYGNTEALRGPDIKPIHNTDSKKRKADGSPVTSSAPTPVPSSVISAAANINPELASAAKKEPSKVSDGPPKPAKIAKKIKAKKELEAGKSKWQDFATKGKFGKSGKKESMFRTGDSVTARGE